ncbi:SET domain-containing protein [Fistulina hepatica ATCC 64428]|uniref:SET domain-containing protein n=1 Tax=Fistulina hepatica ATCC 64428 TaxID=1128425 RepID=A0A0D7ARJ6_9AGAR|nr:SET domain-containing protein [Fistulina hepatica ATCC 64428]
MKRGFLSKDSSAKFKAATSPSPAVEASVAAPPAAKPVSPTFKRGFLNKESHAKHTLSVSNAPAIATSAATPGLTKSVAADFKAVEPVACMPAKPFNKPIAEATPEEGSVEVPSPQSIMVSRTEGRMCTTEEFLEKARRGAVQRIMTYLPPVETGCLFFTGVKERLLARLSWPAPIPEAAQNCYQIGDSLLGGLGLFAVRNIKLGELIIVERPLLITSTAMRMENEIQLLIRALSNCRWNGNGANEEPMMGMVETNSISIDYLPGDIDMTYGAIFNVVSRFNHSCSLSVFGSWDVQSFSYSVRARRDISADEELTYSYLDSSELLTPCAERAAELKRYSFKCKCPSCTDMEPGHSNQSDENRERLGMSLILTIKHGETMLRAIQTIIDNPKEDVNGLVTGFLNTLVLMEQEQLVDDVLCAFHYSCLCKVALATKNEKKARKWVLKAADIGQLYKGPDGGWARVAQYPRQSGWWGRRNHGVAA